MYIERNNTLHRICEHERLLILVVFALSAQNRQTATCLLTMKRRSFRYVENSATRSSDCFHFRIPILAHDDYFDGEPLYYVVL